MNKNSVKSFTNCFKFIPLLMLLFISVASFAQRSITGRVTDSQNGEPLFGASVTVKGANKGTLTDAKGSFTLNNLSDNSILVISFVGFETQELTATGNNLEIKLKAANALRDVVVTAENRAASAQNTSIAIDVVRGNLLQKQNIVNVTQLSNIAPGLNFEQNTVFSEFTVRGVGSHDGAAELSDQAITIGIDGEYINRPVALNAAMFDLDRVEVLKGPQGTLYGRNATAGAVNFIAKKPINKFQSSVFASVGNYGATNLQAMINVPISKTLSMRAAGMWSKHNGYRDADSVGRVDDEDVLGGRIGFNFNPTKAFNLYVAAEANRSRQTAPSQYGKSVVGIVDSGMSPSNFTTAFPKDFPLGNAGFANSDQWAIRGRAEYDYSDAVKLTYTGGYRHTTFEGYQPLNGFIPETFSFSNDFSYNTQSHELRLNGDSKNFIWQTGLFYGEEKQHVARGLLLPFLSGAFGGSPYLNFFLRDVTSKTTGIFAQATYNITEQLSFTGGIRYTADKKDRVASDLSAPPFVPGATVFTYPNHPTSFNEKGMTPLTDVPNDGTWNQVTWLADIDYRIDKTKLLFAKVSTGYKAGGFDNIGEYKPEKIVAYEIGSKNKFLNNRLRLNLSAFHYDYTDQQVSVFISTTVGGAIQNAGSTKINGLELDGEALATKADKFRLTINWLHAEFKDLPTTANVVDAPSVVVNLKGNKPVQSPEWTLVAGYDHNFKVGTGTIDFGISSMFKSSYYLSPFNWAADKQESYTKTDASLTYIGKNDTWDVGIFVHNIEDKRILSYAAFTGNGIDLYNWSFGIPRTYGVQFSYRFK